MKKLYFNILFIVSVVFAFCLGVAIYSVFHEGKKVPSVHKVNYKDSQLTFHFREKPDSHFPIKATDTFISVGVYTRMVWDQNMTKRWFGMFRVDSLLIYYNGRLFWVSALYPVEPEPSLDQKYFLNDSFLPFDEKYIIQKK